MAGVVIKSLKPTKKASTSKRGIYYIGVDSLDISKDNQRQWFDSNNDLITDPNPFSKKIETHKSLQHSSTIKTHHKVFSLKREDYEAYKRSGRDFKDIVRASLATYEQRHGVKLDWIAHIHESEKSKEHPHCHVIISGVSLHKGERGYNRIYFNKDDDAAMRNTFNLEMDRHAKYKFLERIDLGAISKNFSKSFESVMQGVGHEAEKKKREGEFERDKKTRRKGKERGR